MSKENVKAFYGKLSTDVAMQKEIEGLNESLKNETKEKALAGLVVFAKAKGFDFNSADIVDFEKEQVDQLSPEELDKVNAAGLCAFLGISSGSYKHEGGNKPGVGGYACCVIGFGAGTDKG